MRELIHQTQTLDNNCVCTACAIVMGVPAQEVTDKWHDRYMSNDEHVNEATILASYGFMTRPYLSIDNQVVWGNVYLLAVPSLNIIGGMHSIVLDLREEGCNKLYDPAKGREGRKHYIGPDEESDDESAVSLESWTICCSVAIPESEEPMMPSRMHCPHCDYQQEIPETGNVECHRCNKIELAEKWFPF